MRLDALEYPYLLIRCRLLYPAEFNLPADSDYDEQDQDAFEPVDTQLMPLSLQDPKLHYDYTRLPDLP